MKLVIEHGRTKRVIRGPLRICASGKDLAWLAKCITESNMETYGWVDVPEQSVQEVFPNTSVLPWEQCCCDVDTKEV